MYCTCTYDSPVGILRLGAEETFLTGLWLPGQSAPEGTENPDHPVLLQAKAWLDHYFSGYDPTIPRPPLGPRGTAFQQRVWQILLTIPFGYTLTYGQIARMLGKPRASQAVGGAVKRNPISILIPCHRVVGTHSLTGYQGGLKAKQWLLTHEGISTEDYHDAL